LDSPPLSIPHKPHHETISRVHIQYTDCCSSGRGLSKNLNPRYDEMLFPQILSGIEKRCDLVRNRIYTSQIASLMQIAGDTSQCQILGFGRSSMFNGDDVFDLQCSHRREMLRQLTVFADVTCTFSNHLSDRQWNQFAQSLLLRRFRA